MFHRYGRTGAATRSAVVSVAGRIGFKVHVCLLQLASLPCGFTLSLFCNRTCGCTWWWGVVE